MNKPDDPNDTTPGTSAHETPVAGEATTLGKLLRDGSLRHAAPQALRERLRDEVALAERQVRPTTAPVTAGPAQDAKPGADPTNPAHSASPPKPSHVNRPAELAWGPSLAPWLFGGAGGAILGGLAVAMALLVARPPATPQGIEEPAVMGLQPQEIVASHVRALLSQHPIDVVSTDQHTVKPWFNGRIDYAPPVADLSAKGFPLEGGRVDYVGGRTVAVLVYRTDKHPIDVYVFPARDMGAAAPTITGSDGYAIARWRRGGMTYWAITDAEPSHLRVFVEALQAAT
ncbi:anti-sigma factor family protein [Pandoraea cepalis]|uniref:anti-sigma factor family protein n=1 Tax=Pandoraea cepalis TaxID=2508294 RepID=UPI00263B01F3|nr:anti-sigma factor [Pandoraea cepalis]